MTQRRNVLAALLDALAALGIGAKHLAHAAVATHLHASQRVGVGDCGRSDRHRRGRGGGRSQMHMVIM